MKAFTRLLCSCFEDSASNDNESPTKNLPVSDSKKENAELLHVIAVISNPKEYKRRYELALKFIDHIIGFGVSLTVVECQIGQHPFHIPDKETSKYKVIRVRNNSEMWVKENLINIGIKSLPSDAKYVAWIDADVEFENLKWVEQTIEALKENRIVQLFHTCSDLDPNKNILGVHKSFGFCFSKKIGKNTNCYLNSSKGVNFHTGYAWAARLETVKELGGLFEHAIAGSSDRHMAYSFIGKIESSYPGNTSKAYINDLLSWSDRALRVVQGNIGYVHGNIFHYWHGKKADRKYQERWSIIKDNCFDPTKDLTKNEQGVLEWNEHASEKMRKDMIDYFAQRNEDSNEL
jgi:hypothetical protein